MSDVLKRHPAPWSIYDPNGEYVTKRRGVGYRPVYIHDCNGDAVVYVGDRPHNVELAEYIVSAVNAKALAKARKRPRFDLAAQVKTLGADSMLPPGEIYRTKSGKLRYHNRFTVQGGKHVTVSKRRVRK